MNILMYKGIFQYDVVNYFVDEMIARFRESGHKVFSHTIDNQDTETQIAEILLKNDIDFIVSFNGIQAIAYERMNRLIEELNIVMGIILVDHPFLHWQRIQKAKSKNVFIAMYDEGYLKIVEEYIDSQMPIAHLHHGGVEAEYVENNKKYDVIMAGSIQPLFHKIEALEEMPEGILKIIGKNLYKKALDNFNIPLDVLLNEEIKCQHLTPEIFRKDIDFQYALAYIYNLVDLQIRNIMRHKTLIALLEAGIEVQLFGNCEIEELKRFSNLKFHGNLDFKKLLIEMGRAKILIHDVKVFSNGSHERVLSAILNQTLVLSNKNNYCNGDFIDKKNIVFYDVNHLETLVQQTKYYLKHEEERAAIANSAYALVAAQHTWKNRTDELEGIYYSFKEYLTQRNEEVRP